jgi:hypothetical protein
VCIQRAKELKNRNNEEIKYIELKCVINIFHLLTDKSKRGRITFDVLKFTVPKKA